MAAQMVSVQRPICVLLCLSDGGIRRDEPRALRSTGSGNRTGGRLPHRVQLDEICHVLYGRVRKHVHGGVPGFPAVSGGMARAAVWIPAAATTVAGILVWTTHILLHLSVHLDPRHAAALPL